jgi:hypothetical protein
LSKNPTVFAYYYDKTLSAVRLLVTITTGNDDKTVPSGRSDYRRPGTKQYKSGVLIFCSEYFCCVPLYHETNNHTAGSVQQLNFHIYPHLGIFSANKIFSHTLVCTNKISQKILFKPKMSITLLCLVKGNTVANAFAVDIDREKLVSHLKKIIKAEKQNDFAGVDADKLKLWKVEIPDDRDDQFSNLSLQDKDELLATREIEDYWTEKPPKKSVHVIVKLPRKCQPQFVTFRHLPS